MAKKKSSDPAPSGAPRTRAAANSPKSTTRKKSAAKAEVAGVSPDAAADTANDASIVIEQTVTRITYTPSAAEIAEAAYHRFLRRGANHGGDFDDWVEAERELRTRQG